MTMIFQILPINRGTIHGESWLFLSCSRMLSIQKFPEIMQK